MIDEWAKESRPPMRLVLNSRIAIQAKGRDLTEAYICSQQGNHNAAFRLTDNIERTHRPAWCSTSPSCSRTSYWPGMDCPSNRLPAPFTASSNPFFSGLSQLAQGSPVAPPPNGEPGPQVLHPQKLPLHADDVALLRQAIGLP